MKQKDEMPLFWDEAWKNWLFVIAAGLVGFALLFMGIVGLVQDIIAQV